MLSCIYFIYFVVFIFILFLILLGPRPSFSIFEAYSAQLGHFLDLFQAQFSPKLKLNTQGPAGPPVNQANHGLPSFAAPTTGLVAALFIWPSHSTAQRRFTPPHARPITCFHLPCIQTHNTGQVQATTCSYHSCPHKPRALCAIQPPTLAAFSCTPYPTAMASPPLEFSANMYLTHTNRNLSRKSLPCTNSYCQANSHA